MVTGLQDYQLGQVITAIGGLGTAAFGLVDAAKSAFSGINRIGLKHIHEVVSALTPEGAGAGGPVNALPQANILRTLEANWVNGTDIGSQKAIAKSLIKLHLSPSSAPAVAAKASVNPVVLTSVAANLETGTPLSQAESDAYSRFDLIVTALLDEAYQLSDQVYRNWTRTLAAIVAVLLAFAGAWSLVGTCHFWHSTDPLLALLVGLLATPLAPIAKDLSSALATAVNTMQLVKK
ncbi:MAG: hypothetical protein ABSC48_11385 [Terracidiphilus sp.]|jgi:hypothetical protein